MTEHTKTDGLSAQAPKQDAAGDSGTPVTPVRPVAAAKIECNACPVLCQISVGRSGACDRYANHEGVLIRVDPVLVLNRALKATEPALVPFAPGTSEGAWAGDDEHGDRPVEGRVGLALEGEEQDHADDHEDRRRVPGRVLVSASVDTGLPARRGIKFDQYPVVRISFYDFYSIGKLLVIWVSEGRVNKKADSE